MKAGILTIGEELLSGFTVDTNAAWIAQKLIRAGIQVIETSTVGDNLAAITEALERFDDRLDAVIATGGLGPTHDDITKQAFCQYFDSELTFDEDYWEALVQRFNSRGYQIPENNRSQAEVPVKAETLPNSVGSALGLKFQSPKTTFFALPGIPREMKAIMTQEVLPRLGDHEGSAWITIHTSGIFESALAERLESVVAGQPDVKFAFLPDYSGVDVRLHSSVGGRPGNKLVEQAAQAVEDELGQLVFGRDGTRLEQVVVDLLTTQGHTLALAESCSGGLVSSRITDVPGASKVLLGAVVAYSNDVKVNQLGVSADTLAAFGAVSEQVAGEMAVGVRDAFDSTWGVATTGISGPSGGTAEKPVGLVYIAVAGPAKIMIKELRLMPIRLPHKAVTAQTALGLLRREILNHE